MINVSIYKMYRYIYIYKWSIFQQAMFDYRRLSTHKKSQQFKSDTSETYQVSHGHDFIHIGPMETNGRCEVGRFLYDTYRVAGLSHDG